MEYLDPYRVLGVSKDASANEIRRAYRRLAKKYHPDINSDKTAAEMTAKINAAYNQLIDPQKKSAYDNRYSFVTDESVANTIDAYVEDYIDDLSEEDSERTWFTEERQRLIHRFFRIAQYPIAIISFLIILDFFLPVRTELDYPLDGYQKTITRSLVSSYMTTAEYEIQVPNKVHLNYDYSAEEKKLLCMEFTPIFNTLRKVGVDHGEYALMYTAPGTIYYPLLFPIPYLLLALSIALLRKKEYTRERYLLSCVSVALAAMFAFFML